MDVGNFGNSFRNPFANPLGKMGRLAWMWKLGLPPYSTRGYNYLINRKGYIPIATADELDALRNATAQTFGAGSKWEGTYTSGLDKSYILVRESRLEISGEWTLIENFAGICDCAGWNIEKDGAWFNPFGVLLGGEIRNFPALAFNPDDSYMLNPDSSQAFNFTYAA